MSDLQSTLYPFQRDTVERAKTLNGRCLFALSPGLGKSVAAITYIMEEKSFPAVVVCPVSLKYNWAQEFFKHYKKHVHILSGTKPSGKLARLNDSVYILNYDIVHAWLPYLLELKPAIVVFDESHALKNESARRTRACAHLALNTEHCLMLTGTPMIATPMDLYTSLNMLFKGHIVSKWQFMQRYTRWHKTRFGIQILGSRNEAELNTFLLNHCMIRYTTEEVLPDLPPYIRQTTLLEMTASQQREYNHAHEQFIDWLRENFPDKRVPRSEMTAVVTRFGYMKRQVAEWKIPAVLEQIDNFIDGSNDKLIVFGIHHLVMDAIYSHYAAKNKNKSPFIVRLDGTTSAVNKQQAVHHFQTNPVTRIFLGNILAAGTGLTLTASHNTMFTELDFTPANHLQAERRNLRIGQDASFVHWNYLVMKGTLEEQVAMLLFQKQKVCDMIIDGKEANVNFNIVEDLLQAHFDRFKD